MSYTQSEYRCDIAAIKANIDKSNLYHVPQVEAMIANFLAKYFYSLQASVDAEAMKAALNARHRRIPACKEAKMYPENNLISA